MEMEEKLPTNFDYVISRRVLNSREFEEQYGEIQEFKPPSLGRRIRNSVKSFSALRTLTNFFPFCSIISSVYTLNAFVSDVLAGLTMSVLHVPQGMAYGYLAGIKPINGLYSSFFPPLMYFFLGTSRHVSIGTFSVVALLSAEPVNRLAESNALNPALNDTETMDSYRLKVAVTVTVISGLIQLTMGLLNLGFLVEYISAPLLGGFTCASGLHVLSSQLGAMFGLKLKRFTGAGRLIFVVVDFFKQIKNVNLITMAITGCCITVLGLFKFLIDPKVSSKIHFPIPIEIVVLILGTLVSKYTHLENLWHVKVVGELPRGLPYPLLPDMSITADILLESAIVSFVALATTVSLVKLYANKSGYDVRYTQEMNALGISNVFGGFFRCQAASGALARTSVAYGAGMRSQVASLVSCCVLLLVLTLIGPVFEDVPLCVLASIIAVSLTGILLQIRDVPRLFWISPIDAIVWIVTFLATTLLNVPLGLVTGLCFSVLTTLFRTQRSFCYELGQLPDTDIYMELGKYEQAIRIPGLAILRFGGPLYYANCHTFTNWVYGKTKIDPHKVKAQRLLQTSSKNLPCCSRAPGLFTRTKTRDKDVPNGTEDPGKLQPNVARESTSLSGGSKPDKIHSIILDISSWSYTDSVGAKTLLSLVKDYENIDIRVLFTCCQSPVKNTLVKAGFGVDHFKRICFLSVHDAVLYAKLGSNQ
ncbi:unnamed protein product [Calicophoron daubneyi]|uniref:STAS domain-containing protein n=1 Tax=Calicophoron daubneyi TaxID=300641 RepID=A0AAV2TEF8_CALDB